MISIIICSISPDRLRAIQQNIWQTVGVEYEIISIDNNEKRWSIAKAYNYGAQQAKFPYLFFVHEDVKFHSQNWGEFIVQKLKEPDCGVIGFAGSKVRLNCYTGWGSTEKYDVTYLYQGLPNGLTAFSVSNSYLQHPFENVVVLDGLGIFVRKEVWSSFPFDEQLLTGFHCYDLDFSLQIVASGRYKNYVCCSNQVLIEHFSLGSFNESWYVDTIRLHQKKWKKLLPIKVDGCELSDKEQKKIEERLTNIFLRNILKTKCAERKIVLSEFLDYSFSWKHLGHCITAIFKFISMSLKPHK